MVPKLAAASVALTLCVFAAGCSHGKTASAEQDSAAAIDTSGLGSSDDGKAMGLQTVHFPYDSSLLDATSKSELASNAAILKDKPAVHIQIEGHCDERGGVQYNIALGERRATAVKKYLEDLGVADARLETVSYGKERLLFKGSDEDSMAKNRRAAFVVTQLK
jgi:peptidoglycan-associated lipoprotein